MADDVVPEERPQQQPPPRPPGSGFDRSQVVGGVVLVAIGALLLFARSFQDIGRYIPLGVGIVLLVAFLLTRQYGFLVPGCIVSGVGVGILLVSADPSGTRGTLFLVSLGLGFIAIWVIGLVFRLSEHHWWPLIPGSILTTIGALVYAGSGTADLLNYWPVVLVVIGVIVLAQAFVTRDRS
jgi:hypothetical protein